MSHRVRSIGIGGIVAAWAALSVAAVVWLLVRTFADVWRSPALLPQAWGSRGLDVARDNALLSATVGSFATALVAASIGCLLVLPAAAVIDRVGARLRGAVIGGMLVPVLIPGGLVGLGMATFGTRTGVEGSPLALVLAHLPFVLAWQTVCLLGAWDRTLRAREDAAAVNGMAPLAVFRHITLPGARRAAALAWAVGFLVSWAQYATSLLIGSGVDVLPVRLVPFVASDPQVAAAFGLVYTAVPAFLGLLVLLDRRRIGA